MEMPQSFKMIQSVDRSLAILDALAKAGDIGYSLGEISRETGLHASTAHHLLATLILRHIVEQDPSSKFYRLGVHMIELGNVARKAASLTRLARPYLEAIWDATKQGTSLLIFHGLVRTPILHLNSQRILTAQSAPLEPGTLHATGSGKLLLAFLSEAELENYLQKHRLERFTARTIANREALFQELERIRQQGFALDSAEYGDGVNCIAMPFHDATRQVAGCFDVIYPAYDFTAEQTQAWIKELARNSAELSQQLRSFELAIR